MHRPHPHIVLESPQRNLNSVSGNTTIAAGQPIAVLRPQLTSPQLIGKLLSMPHSVDEPRPTILPKRRRRLIDILRHELTLAPAQYGLPAVT